nr:periodic tryptophan protein 1 homolog [Cherax quadricarinatus]XP_053641433.1 periodic tryptophan protein 1 homolog [Cherax quadricarinatus]XP_053641441.1 periodic tryptophan protein 1 homolog [Cherax quadricarinatus]
MEEDEKRVSFITCAAWVPKGVAAANPEKVEISKEDLGRIIQETKGKVEDLEELDNEEDEEIEEDAVVNGKENKEDLCIALTSEGQKKASESKKLLEEDEAVDFETRYSISNYDNEKDDKVNQLLQIGMLTIHASNDDDPYVTIKDHEDHDSEDENHVIFPTDNLIAVGHIEGDAAILEVYVYNGEESSFYVHHDILLPAAPLCMEWLNYDPGDEQLKPANMVAIGSMSPEIQVWDLDLIDCLEPAYTLGKRGKKKKKIPGIGHKQPVLSLAWNKHAEKAKMFDCRDNSTFKTWELDGEIECVIWETHTDKPYNCLASTDKGTVFGIDGRQNKPLWTLNAHSKACTGIQMSPQCPGCLVSASSDGSIKIWDIASGKPSFIEESNPSLGTIQCLASCPDAPFVFCFGGDNKQNNFKVWDLRESSNARSRFCPRIRLPVDDEEMDLATPDTALQNLQSTDEGLAAATGPSCTVAPNQSSGKKTKSKFKKKKGGHLERRRKT